MDSISNDYKTEIKRKKIRYFDYSLLVVVVLLLAFGLVMLYSTSSYDASINFNDPLHYLKRQLFAVGLGIVALIVVAFIDYHIISYFAWPVYLLSLAACVLVIFMGVAQGTSSRWFYIGPISVQPSEIGKVACILLLSALIAKNQKQIKNWRYLLKLFGIVLPLIVAVGYNNLSTAIIIFAICYIMLFIAGRQFWFFVGIAGLGALFIFAFISFWGYRSQRISIWKDPESYEQGYQVMQGLYAIGSGGLFGKGLGESYQKMYLPEAQNDMIFSVVCEELGIIGAVCIIIMYLLLLWRCMIIALNARDTLGSFMVIGVMVHISLQVILNIAVVTNTIPNTGVTLPFISYGGTSISILVAEMGLVLSVSRGIYLK